MITKEDLVYLSLIPVLSFLVSVGGSAGIVFTFRYLA